MLVAQKFRLVGGSRACFFAQLLRHTTAAAAAAAEVEPEPQKPHFLEGFLINSLGFSKAEALSTAKKVIDRKSTRKNLNLVINFLEEKLGLRKTHIKSIISICPRLLVFDVDKTLQPKVSFLQDHLGLSGLEVAKLILSYKSLLAVGLDSEIRPSIEYLKKLLGSDERVTEAVKKFPSLVCSSVPKRIEANVLLLRKVGFSNEDVSRFIRRSPKRILVFKPELLQDVLHRVEYEFGIPRQSKMFYYAVETFCSLSKSLIDPKLDVFRSFGWSDPTIYTMVSIFPNILLTSEDKMRRTLNFFMEELGYNPEYLAYHPMLFHLNLEKRVKPRNQVFQALNEKQLNKRKFSLYSVLCLPKSKFLEHYLSPYKDQIPHVYESYMKAVGT